MIEIFPIIKWTEKTFVIVQCLGLSMARDHRFHHGGSITERFSEEDVATKQDVS